jgi:hypothetical protein
MRWLLQWSFGCRHANTSFPQTVPSRRRHPAVATSDGHPNVGAIAKVTYVTCLRCGREFNYCWRTMQRLSSPPNWAPTWIEEQMTGNCSSRELREIEELRHLWMT